MNILLAVDGSPYSKAALDAVLERPWPEGSHVKVLTVVEPFHPEYAGWQTAYVPLAVEVQQEQMASAKGLIDSTGEHLGAKFGAANVTLEVVEGYIKDRILEEAKNWPADLIVVGSHGRRGFTKFLLGSVSEAIVAHAPCSVEIVKLREHPPANH
ncbi:MAG TPA: universal stress protein [Drouetiella sp.]